METTEAEEETWQSTMDTVGEAAQYLFDNPQLSDIIFSCQDSNGAPQKIYAHSWFLVMRSSVFYNDIQASIGKSQVILILDYSYETFLSFMRYVYSAGFEIDAINVAELFNVGKKYKMGCLLKKINKFIENVKFSITNVCDYLELSLKVENNQLKANAIEFIGVKGKQIINTESFNSLSPDAVKEILSRDVDIFDVSEVEIFECMMEWAKHRCRLNNYEINSINMRRSLGELIKMIRFTTMSSIEFAECIEKYPGLLSIEEDRSLLLSIVKQKPDENELRFLKPRKAYQLDLSQFYTFKCFIGDKGNPVWKKSLPSRSKF